MSFSIRFKKNAEGSYDIISTDPQYTPDLIEIGGHIEERPVPGNELQLERDVVDITVRCKDLVASASKRKQYFFMV